ncbi:hypothetical protein NA8A_20647 [Nitratireductor indicus C115]|uniref:Uncharacterized protein n=1 Tax=Nitratireductor indicus C115 TaxID=1231190 RepID=K2PHH4_9HYPH|nr:hypothetical protein NA8A_20647 [Nitratireductor indicus C115]
MAAIYSTGLSFRSCPALVNACLLTAKCRRTVAESCDASTKSINAATNDVCEAISNLTPSSKAFCRVSIMAVERCSKALHCVAEVSQACVNRST